MKYFIVLLLFIMSCLAQSNTPDEKLLNQIQSESNEKVLSELYGELVVNNQYTNTAKAIEYAEKSIQHAVNASYFEQQVKSTINLGATYCYMGEHVKSKSLSNDALELSIQHKWKAGEAIALEAMGRCAKEISDFETALHYYNEALKITLEENIEDPGTLVPVYGNMAGLYALLKRWDQSIAYYHKAEALSEGDTFRMMVSYINLSYAYVNKGEFELGQEYAEKLISIAKEENSEQFIAFANNMLGERYYLDYLESQKTELLGKAKKHFSLALSTLKNFDKNINYSSTILYYGRVLYDLAEYNSSIAALAESLEVATILKLQPDIAKSNYFLALNYLQLKQYDLALSHIKNYKKVSEKHFEDSMSEKISSMMIRFDTQSKEQEILKTRLQNETLKKDAQVNFFITLTILLCATFIILTLYILVRSRNKQAKIYKELSHKDNLTNLLNRRAIESEATKEIERFNRTGVPFSVVLADIDHFKLFNDKYGHDCGDAVLKLVSKKLSDSVRSVDTVARWGGEEFLFILTDSELATAAQVTEKIRKAIADAHFDWHGESLKITMSFGVTQIKSGESFDVCVKKADDALYEAKERGRNCVSLATSTH